MRYNKGSLSDTVKAAKSYAKKAGRPCCIFAGQTGYNIWGGPPTLQDWITVHPDGQVIAHKKDYKTGTTTTRVLSV